MPRLKKVKTLTYLCLALVTYLAYKTFFKNPALPCVSYATTLIKFFPTTNKNFSILADPSLFWLIH